MSYFSHPMLQVLCEPLRTLETDPGRITPERAEVMSYLRKRIAVHMSAAPLQTA